MCMCLKVIHKELHLPKYTNIQMFIHSLESFHKKHHTFMYQIWVAGNNSETYLEDKTSVQCGRWYKNLSLQSK